MISVTIILLSAWCKSFGFRGFINDSVAIFVAAGAEIFLELCIATIWSESRCLM